MTALVTRPEPEAQGLRAALVTRGVDVFVEPMLKVVFDDRKTPDFTGLQGYLASSANGVRALARLDAPRDVPLWAVGDATAQVARSLGFLQVESAGGAVGDLAGLVEARCQAGAGAFLHASARETAGDLGGLLGVRGLSVRREILYWTEPPKEFSASLIEALRLARIRWAFFFSPRSAGSFVTLSRRAGLEGALRGITALAMSGKVAAGLGGVEWGRILVSGQPNQDAMLELFDTVRAIG